MKKKLFEWILIFSIITAALTACGNLYETNAASATATNFSSSKNVITGSISSTVNGAVPSSLKESSGGNQNAVNSKSALPSVTLSDYQFTVEDENANMATVNQTTRTFSILLADGDHILTAKGYKDDGSGSYTQQVFFAVTTVTITDGAIADGSTLTMNLSPISTSGNYGYVNLPVTVGSDTGITSVTANWESSGSAKCQTLSIDATASTPVLTDYFTMKDDTDLNTNNAVGTYAVSFKFYSGTGNAKYLVYSFTEAVNVFSNLTTDTWKNSSGALYISDSGISVTSTLTASYGLTAFHVNAGSGSDSNSGGYFDPFKTVQHAVDVIKSQNDGSTQYKIVLMADAVADSSQISDTVNASGTSLSLGDSFVRLTSSSTLKLTITSDDSGTYSLNANSSSTTEVRTIYVGDNVRLTLKNVKVTDGYISEKSGAGIYVDTNGYLYLENNTTITGNHLSASTTKSFGAGAYCAGTLTMSSGVSFDSNGGTGTMAFGGGLAAGGNASLTISGGTFTGNTIGTAGQGAAIYAGNHLDGSTNYIPTLKISGGTIMDAGQTIYLGYDASCSVKQTYITLGTLSGTEAAQKFYLDLEDYTSGNQVLKSGTDYSSTKSRFVVYKNGADASSDYVVDSNGKLCIPVYSGSLSYTTDDVTISVSPTQVYSTLDNKLTVKAVVDSGLATEKDITSTSDATDWDIKVYSDGKDISSNSKITISNTSADRSVTVGSGVVADTVIQVYVSFTYNGKSYGGSITLTVTDL